MLSSVIKIGTSPTIKKQFTYKKTFLFPLKDSNTQLYQLHIGGEK